jgi:hypothetical protein
MLKISSHQTKTLTYYLPHQNLRILQETRPINLTKALSGLRIADLSLAYLMRSRRKKRLEVTILQAQE